MAAKTVIHRVTMFKIPDAANIQPILDQYAKMQTEAKKVGRGVCDPHSPFAKHLI